MQGDGANTNGPPTKNGSMTVTAAAGIRICLVDSNAWAASTLQGILAAFGYDVSVFEGGAQAVPALQAAQFDIVLLAETSRPRHELVCQIRQSPALTHIPIIAFSQLAAGAFENNVMAHGATATLPATSAPERIHDLICEILANDAEPDSEKIRLGMLVSSAHDASIQQFVPQDFFQLDLFFSAGEALLAIPKRPYRGFIVVTHQAADVDPGGQFVAIVRQLIDPTGLDLSLIVVSAAENAYEHFISLGANQVIPMEFASALTESIAHFLNDAESPDPPPAQIGEPAVLLGPDRAIDAPPETLLRESKQSQTATPAPAASTNRSTQGEPAKKKERGEREGPPPPPTPVLKNKKARRLLEENSTMFKQLFPDTKEFKL